VADDDRDPPNVARCNNDQASKSAASQMRKETDQQLRLGEVHTHATIISAYKTFEVVEERNFCTNQKPTATGNVV